MAESRVIGVSSAAGRDATASGASSASGIAATAGSPSGNGEWRPFAIFTGAGWELFKIYLLVLLFSVLTLGVYAFWGKVKIRKYLWENTSVLGENLEYTGTGGELFRSFLIVMLFGAVGTLGLNAGMARYPLAAPFVLFLILLPLTHLASYQALRYRLTRTRWRGIKGNMDGSAVGYAVTGTGYSLMTLLTLLISLPLETARLTARRLNATFFGNRRLLFSGSAKTLFAPWLKTYVLLALFAAGLAFALYEMRNSLVSAALDMKPELLGAGVLACFFAAFLLAGLLTLAYQAAVVRWLFANLAFGDMRFEAKGYTTLGLVKLTAGNLLLLLVTLGLARPWMEMRILRFFWSNIRYSGDPKLRELLQDTLPERSGGEGLLDALDMDLSI